MNEPCCKKCETNDGYKPMCMLATCPCHSLNTKIGGGGGRAESLYQVLSDLKLSGHDGAKTTYSEIADNAERIARKAEDQQDRELLEFYAGDTKTGDWEEIKGRLEALHPQYFVDEKTWQHDFRGTLDIIKQREAVLLNELIAEVEGMKQDCEYCTSQYEETCEISVSNHALNKIKSLLKNKRDSLI